MSFKDKLKKLKENWESSQGTYDQMFGGVEVPAGLYLAKLRAASIAEAKSNGKLMIRREHLITEGDYQGMVVWDNLMLETPNGPVYVRRWIEMMGYENPADPSDLEDVIKAIVNDAPTVKIRLTRDGDFTNVSITEMLDVAPEVPASTPAKATPAKPASAPSKSKAVTDTELKLFCQETGIDANAKDLLEEIKSYEWDAENLTADQIAVLQKHGVEVKGVEAPSDDAPSDDVDAEIEELKNRLIQFCTAQDVEYEEEDDIDVLKERINGFQFPENELTPEEIALLKEIGQEANIVKPVKTPPKAPPAKAAPSAPPKKSAPAAPAKATPAKVPPKKR